MNIYTQAEREAQAALELVKALEAKHGWQGVRVTITEDTDADARDGKRHVRVNASSQAVGVGSLPYAYTDADDLAVALEAEIFAAIDKELKRGVTLGSTTLTADQLEAFTGAKAQAAERLGANLDKLHAAVADSDLTRADVEAETKAVQQPKAPARKRKPAPKKATPKGKA
jgi:hypothetical protein